MDFNMTNMNFTDFEQLNAERRTLLVPVTSFLVVVMVTGIVGNLFVVCVYGRRYYRNTAILCILTLGLTHLFFDTLLLPFEIYKTVNPFIHHIRILCNVWRFLETFTNTFTVLILVCMAFDRFLNTRQPFQMMSLKQAKTLLVVMLLLALALTWPRSIVNGKQPDLFVTNGIGTNCELEQLTQATIYSLLFQGTLCAVFGICFLACVIVYVIIAIIYCRRNSQASANMSNVSLGSLRRKKFERVLISRALESMNLELINGTRNVSKIHIRPGYLTIMLCVVTVMTLAGYVPYICVQILLYTSQTFNDMLPSHTLMYELCSNSYLLNNAVTPLIYCFLDRRFRQECVNGLKNIFRQKCFKPDDYI